MKLRRLFGKKRIYADAAAATPVSRRARKELVRLLGLYGNPGGLHAEAVEAKAELEAARERAAKAIGAHPDEIFFTTGGTESNNLAIFGALRRLLRVGEETHAITTAIEHSSVLEPLRTLVEEGLLLTELPVERGAVEGKMLREALTDNTALVSVQMVNSEVGTIQDIRAIAKEVRHARKEREDGMPLYFHTDASQAPLWLPLMVEHLGVDMMTLDAQKMMGPKGVGILYIKRSVQLEPVLWGGGQERGLRSGTENVPLAGALAAALEEAQQGVEVRASKTARVRDYLLEGLEQALPGAVLNGLRGDARVANNVNLMIPGLRGDMAVIALDARGVAASVRSACDTDEIEPSHVLAALGLSPDQAKDSIRITLLPGATKRQARRIVRALSDVAATYRKT